MSQSNSLSYFNSYKNAANAHFEQLIEQENSELAKEDLSFIFYSIRALEFGATINIIGLTDTLLMKMLSLLQTDHGLNIHCSPSQDSLPATETCTYDAILCAEYQDNDLFDSLKPNGLLLIVHQGPSNYTKSSAALLQLEKLKYRNVGTLINLTFARAPVNVKSMNNTVWVFIPVHNRAAFTMNCLSTLLEQSVAKQFKIHVIDDGSSDDTAAIIKRDFPTVTIIPGSGNLWWTGAIAKGIETCKEHFKKGDFFLLVNNDAALDANTVETLLYEAVLDRAVAWSPLAIANGSPLACAEAGHTLYHMNLMVSSIQQYQGSIPAKAQFGRCTLYPVEILDVANNFDAKYFPHYWGDTDFAIRAAKHGYHYMVTSKACLRVQHDTQTTGLHFNYFEKPQSIKTVWDCLTLYSSYFNCIHHWRYLKRHDRKGRHMEWFLRTWKVIHQYHVFYYTNKIARKFLGYL